MAIAKPTAKTGGIASYSSIPAFNYNQLNLMQTNYPTVRHPNIFFSGGGGGHALLLAKIAFNLFHLFFSTGDMRLLSKWPLDVHVLMIRRQ